MRYLKRQNINHRTANHASVFVDYTDTNVVLSPTNAGSVVLPMGTSSQRPATPVNGMMRYNTEVSTGGEVEVYQSGVWRSLRFKEATGITQQNLGAGDDVNTIFGPLSPQPPSVVANNTTWGGQNIIVVVENVIQLNSINYTVVQNPTFSSETYTVTTSISTAFGSNVLYLNSSLTATNATGNGTTVSLSYPVQSAAPFAVGSTIVVTGFMPQGYNGNFVVTACTTTQVSYASTFTTAMTYPGNITSRTATFPTLNLVGSTVTGSGIQASTTVTSYTLDSITDVLTSISLSRTTNATIATNSNLTLVEPTRTISSGAYYLQFTTPVPIGKVVTVLIGFDQ
jgi:hypothetical protein